MPRRKISMRLIPNRRLRANTFAKRKEGLKKKADELSKLCGVRVALVCGAGAGAADVWESEAGVIDAYRDVPPEERAKHTHAAYAEVELRKAEGKLVRVRQDGAPALAPCDAAVYALTLDGAQRLLGAVDGALRVVNDRRAALGLPLDDDAGGGWLNGFAAPGASDALGLAAPSFAGSNLVSVDGGYLPRAQGSDSNEQQVVWESGGFEPFSAAINWQPGGYAFQQCAADMDGYKLQKAAADMYANNSNNSIGRLPWDASHSSTNAVSMQPAYGSDCTGAGNSYVGGMSGYLTQQMPSNAIVPFAGYPSLNYVDTLVAHQGGDGGRSLAISDFSAAMPLAMGAGDNFISAPQAQPLAMSYNGDLVNASEFVSQWAAGQL
jgi:hypothetical protein